MSRFSAAEVGSFRIVEELGPVPGGEACRAVDTRSDTPLVLKAVPLDSAEGVAGGMAAALAEVRRLGRLDRQGLPAIYEVSEEEGEGVALIAFAPPEGRSLRRWVLEGGRVDRERLVAWMGRLLGLLAEAHSHDVLHRHLGPEAVVIGDDDRPSLVGFSLTQLADDAPEFQPPEARRGEPWTAQSDLFALGGLFLRLAAPASMGGAAERSLDPSDPLLAVLARATAGNPRGRYRDAADMEEAVRAAARTDVTTGQPPFATQMLRPAEIRSQLAARGLPVTPLSPSPAPAEAPAAPALEPTAITPAPSPRPPARRWRVVLSLLALLLLALVATWCVSSIQHF